MLVSTVLGRIKNKAEGLGVFAETSDSALITGSLTIAVQSWTSRTLGLRRDLTFKPVAGTAEYRFDNTAYWEIPGGTPVPVKVLRVLRFAKDGKYLLVDGRPGIFTREEWERRESGFTEPTTGKPDMAIGWTAESVRLYPKPVTSDVSGVSWTVDAVYLHPALVDGNSNIQIPDEYTQELVDWCAMHVADQYRKGDSIAIVEADRARLQSFLAALRQKNSYSFSMPHTPNGGLSIWGYGRR